MKNLVNTQVDAFKAVFIFGKFDNVQGGRVFVPFVLCTACVILAFGHIPKF
jgi:hypothetical protein